MCMENKAELHESSWQIAKKNALLSAAKGCCTLTQAGIFLAVWYLAYPYHGAGVWSGWRGVFLAGIYLALFSILGHIYSGFQVGRAEGGELAYSLVMAQLFTVFFQYCVLCVVTSRILNPLPMVLLLAVGGAYSALWALCARRLYHTLFPARKTCILYDDAEALHEVEAIHDLKWKFEICGAISIANGLEHALQEISAADAVFLCGIHSSDRNVILKYCIERGIQVYIRPKIGDLLISGASQLQLINMPILHCARNRTSLLYRGTKRLMDVVMAGLALIVASPVMAVVAVAIHRCDGGPAFYRQTRLTQDGKQFEILKFRSMRVDAEKDGVARLASEGDDRITPVGRLIRKVRIDELPQLINILKGDMSIVGPRPERPEIAAQYEEEMPEFSLRLQAKAGLTGYAQVYGKYNTRPYDKLQMDLMYIANQSILMDLKIIFVTVKVLFMKESTEGVRAGQLTAAGGHEQENDRAG